MKTNLKISKVNYNNGSLTPDSVIVSGLKKDVESKIYLFDYRGTTYLDLMVLKKLWNIYKNEFHRGLKISSTIHRSGILGYDSLTIKVTDKNGNLVNRDIVEDICNLGHEILGFNPCPWGTLEFKLKKFIYDKMGNKYLIGGLINMINK